MQALSDIERARAQFKVACIIPARLQSSRFPRKVLLDLGGIPILQRIWNAASAIKLFNSVTFAIDAPETAALISTFKGNYYMTSVDCQTGTDRIIEVVKQGLVTADVFVGWQADSPFINQAMIQQLLQSCAQRDADVWTLKKRIESPEELVSPHTAKVVCDAQGYALYFSRSPIPYKQGGVIDCNQTSYFKHIGLYAYTEAALEKISKTPVSELETVESLEQLRFLQENLRIKVHETGYENLEINIPYDLDCAERYIKANFR